MKFSIKILLYLVIALIAFLLLYSLIIGYKVSIESAISIINQEKYNEKIKQLITEGKFHIVQILALLFLVVLSISAFYFDIIYNKASNFVRGTFKSLLLQFSFTFSSKGKYILAIPVFASIFYAINIPISYDEAWTYLNFTSKGIVSSMCYYPAPNNHILNSVVSNITYHIPFIIPLIKLRITSILVSIVTWVISYSYLSRRYNENFSMAVIAISTMLIMVIGSSFMARGYAFILLFFNVSLFSTLNIIDGNSSTKNWVFFSIASVLGFYSIPIFLYPFVIFNLLIFVYNPKNVKKQIIANAVIGILVFLLYLPIIVINGIGSLTNNAFVASISRASVVSQLPTFFYNAISDIMGIHSLFVLVAIIISLFVLFLKRDSKSLILYGILFISPFVLLTIHSVVPPSRVFIYYGFVIVLLVFTPYHQFISKFRFSYLIPILIAIQVAFFANFNRSIRSKMDNDIISNEIAKKISGDYAYVCNDGLFDTFLLYYLNVKGFKNYQIDYKNTLPMSADTIVGKKYVIIDNRVDKTIKAIPKIRTKYYTVY